MIRVTQICEDSLQRSKGLSADIINYLININRPINMNVAQSEDVRYSLVDKVTYCPFYD